MAVGLASLVWVVMLMIFQDPPVVWTAADVTTAGGSHVRDVVPES